MMTKMMTNEMFEAIENELKNHSTSEKLEDMLSDMCMTLRKQGFKVVIVNDKGMTFENERGFCIGTENIWFRRNNKLGCWKTVRVH